MELIEWWLVRVPGWSLAIRAALGWKGGCSKAALEWELADVNKILIGKFLSIITAAFINIFTLGW